MQLKFIITNILLAITSLMTVKGQAWSANGSNLYYTNGNVGIGITAPQGKLHVYGGNAFLWGLSLGYGTSPAVITTDAPKPLSFQINGTEYVRLDNTGNFGVGVTAPSEKLTVGGNIRLTGQIYWTSSNRTIREIVQPDGSNVVMRFQNSMYQADGNPNGGFDFTSSDGTSVMRILNGNVGIGTTDTKGYRLAVNGDAVFTKVKVKLYTNWPDYVFQRNYGLQPLSEVEQFIQHYQHLPDLPSSIEVEKNGLDLGDSQAVLLKKIEELTLYLIQQDKELQILKATNQKLEKQQQELDELKLLVLQLSTHSK